MAASVLSVLEQKDTLSGKKKKKKTIKNILGLPNNVKVESNLISNQEAEKLRAILERLLPSAKLPFAKCKNDINEDMEDAQMELLKQAKAKRNQLSLGVNALNKNIKKNIISSALLAGDIQPKFLVHHLNLLCNHNNIPLIHMPGLRDITHQTLGFPCICVGFKKNSDFSEAVEEIRSLAKDDTTESKNVMESSSESCSSDEDLNDELFSNKKTKQDDNQFDYFYRTSIKERMFVPNLCEKNVTTYDKLESEFISLHKDKGNEKFTATGKGISTNLINKQKKKKKLSSIRKFDFVEMSDEEDFKTLKKKVKKGWIIDKVGTKKMLKYSPANVYKLHSNPNRVKNNCK